MVERSREEDGSIIQMVLGEIRRANEGITSLRTAGRLQDALRLSTQTLALAEASGEPLLLARTQLGYAFILLELGRHLDAMELFESAEKCSIELEDTALHGLALRGMGRAYFQKGDYVSSLTTFRRAMELAAASGKERTVCVELGHMANVHRAMGDYDRAFELHRRQLSTAASLQSRRLMCVCLGNLANICRLRGDLSKACGLHRESIELARESGNRLSECIALGNLGACLARLGKKDEAMEAFSGQLRIAREACFRNEISGALGNIGQVLRESGRYEEAMARFNEQFRSAWEDNDNSLMSFALGNIASIHALRGDFDRAITCAERLIMTGRRSQDSGVLAQGLAALGRYCMFAGGLEEDAESYLTSAAGHLEDLGLASSLSECLFDLASLRKNTGSELAMSTAGSALQAALAAGDESMTLLSRMLIASIRGKTEPESATSDLEGLLSDAPDDEHAAAIHYELYRLTGREENRAGAERLYRRLSESFPNVENRRRLSEVALEGR